MDSKIGRAMLALDRAGGPTLTTALRMGYAGAARVIRDKAKLTTAFKDRTGVARRAWKVTQNRKPYNHAKVVNTAFYSLFLENQTRFLTRAAEATGPEQMDAVHKAILRHLRKLPK